MIRAIVIPRPESRPPRLGPALIWPVLAGGNLAATVFGVGAHAGAQFAGAVGVSLFFAAVVREWDGSVPALLPRPRVDGSTGCRVGGRS